MSIKHLKNKPLTEGHVSYHVLTEVLEDKMSDDEFNKAMAALEDIWNSCPKDFPRDLSQKHDQYLFGVKK
jgi:hypothetical protein